LQAQSLPAAILAVWPRGPQLTAAQVEKARVEERAIARTWVMRGTLHLVATQDLGWLLALFGPLHGGLTRRMAQLGFDEASAHRGLRVLRRLLVNGPATRDEIRAALVAKSVPAADQATIHLIAHAAFQGLLCYGPQKAGEESFVLLADWLPDPQPTIAEPAAELARRYFAAFGPATLADFVAWSGLPRPNARAAMRLIGGELAEVALEGQSYWHAGTGSAGPVESDQAGPLTYLLPAFDPLLVGYEKREWLASPAVARRIHPGGGVIRPTVVVNSRAEGVWRLQRRRASTDVVVEPLGPLAGNVLAALEESSADLGRFLQQKCRLVVAEATG
jgi:hypothetical protein